MRAKPLVLSIIAAAQCFGIGAASATAKSASGPPASINESRLVASHHRASYSCQRWRSIAARLGETYAGHKLRHLVSSTKSCTMLPDNAEEAVWSWPWRSPELQSDLPPELHGRFGAWEIRCGQAGLRRRCTLALQTAMAASLDAETLPLRVVTHLVIDSVAGRESLLWRVHVARDLGSVEKDSGVVVRWSARELSKTFDACGAYGCLAEAEPVASAEVAAALWSGRAVSISLASGDQQDRIVGLLPTHGFKQGLAELIRLRRSETATGTTH